MEHFIGTRNRRKAPRLDAERQQLVLAHLKLPFFIVNRYFRHHATHRMPLDELESLAMFTLVRAAAYFDPRRGFKFCGFAGYCIRVNLARALRLTRKRDLRAGSLEHEPPAREEPPWHRDGDNAALVERIRFFVQRSDFDALLSHFGHGEKLRDIGRRHGMSGECVRKRLRRAVTSLRKSLPEYVEGAPRKPERTLNRPILQSA